MEFGFLDDCWKRIFAIGYRLGDADGPGTLDGSFYDLLASEARLASFIAIASGDVPQHHWFHLGLARHQCRWAQRWCLAGGTMFQYRCCCCRRARIRGRCSIRAAARWCSGRSNTGRDRGVPWEVSESAYAFTDRAGSYQDPAFWVPGPA